MQGAAHFVRRGAASWRQEERVAFQIDGRPIVAEQAYLWDQVDERVWAVCFSDGRPFVTLAFSASAEWTGFRAAAEHLCGDDHYSGAAVFLDDPARGRRWAWRWRVEGPSKDYDAVSIFRADGAASDGS